MYLTKTLKIKLPNQISPKVPPPKSSEVPHGSFQNHPTKVHQKSQKYLSKAPQKYLMKTPNLKQIPKNIRPNSPKVTFGTFCGALLEPQNLKSYFWDLSFAM